HQEESRTVFGEDNWIGSTHSVQLLILLRQPEHRNGSETGLVDHRVRRTELALSTVDDDQVGKRRETVIRLPAVLLALRSGFTIGSSGINHGNVCISRGEVPLKPTS